MYLNIIWLSLAAIVGIIAWASGKQEKQSARLVAVAAVAFVVGLTVFGAFFLKSREVDKGLRVTGYANKMFESDLVKWTLVVQKTTDPSGLKSAYTGLSKDIGDFKANLIAQGIQEKDFNIQPPISNANYDAYGNLSAYNVNQSIYILSSDIPKVEKIALDPGFFGERGLLLQQSNLEYLYSKLPELKKQLIGEATSDALARAQEVSAAAKTRLGKLKSARAGVFQITEPYSTDVADYGYYSTSTRSKSISVTVSAEFGL